MYRIWSTVFLGGDVEQNACYTTLKEWTTIHARFPDAKRIFLRCKAGEREAVCALAQPLDAVENFMQDVPPVFIPDWVQNLLSFEAEGSVLPVEWLTEEFFPEATKIVLRPHDSAFYHSDAKEELEHVLTRYGVLQTGSTIPVPLSVLEGFTVLFDVVGLEPANIVLLEGEEVAIEFEEAMDAIPSTVVAPVAPVERAPTPFPDAVLPIQDPPIITGEILGGKMHAPLADGRPWNPWR